MRFDNIQEPFMVTTLMTKCEKNIRNTDKSYTILLSADSQLSDSVWGRELCNIPMGLIFNPSLETHLNETYSTHLFQLQNYRENQYRSYQTNSFFLFLNHLTEHVQSKTAFLSSLHILADSLQGRESELIKRGAILKYRPNTVAQLAVSVQNLRDKIPAWVGIALPTVPLYCFCIYSFFFFF